jgi:hypothetical protein
MGMRRGTFMCNNEKNIVDDDEPFGLSLSSTIQEKTQKTTTTIQKVHCHL